MGRVVCVCWGGSVLIGLVGKRHLVKDVLKDSEIWMLTSYVEILAHTNFICKYSKHYYTILVY